MPTKRRVTANPRPNQPTRTVSPPEIAATIRIHYRHRSPHFQSHLTCRRLRSLISIPVYRKAGHLDRYGTCLMHLSYRRSQKDMAWRSVASPTPLSRASQYAQKTSMQLNRQWSTVYLIFSSVAAHIAQNWMHRSRKLFRLASGNNWPY